MADIKSSEGKLTTLECMECGYREVFTERQFKFTDGLSCYVCNGPTRPTFTRQGDKIRNRRMDKELNRIGDINSKNGIDVANTIKGLKAIQREAKKATASLKELEDKFLTINQQRVKLGLKPIGAEGDKIYKSIKGCNPQISIVDEWGE